MRRTSALLIAALVPLMPACGDDGDADAACQPEVRERLDPDSGRHLIPGADPPVFRTDPPTSGPHQLGRWPQGVLDEPVRPEVQVALLEEGEVLLQHRDLDRDERRALEALADGDERLTVAPNPELPDRVVATAWTFKQTCRTVRADALRRFVDAHAGKGG